MPFTAAPAERATALSLAAALREPLMKHRGGVELTSDCAANMLSVYAAGGAFPVHVDNHGGPDDRRLYGAIYYMNPDLDEGAGGHFVPHRRKERDVLRTAADLEPLGGRKAEDKSVTEQGLQEYAELKAGLLRDVSSLPSLTTGDVFNAGAAADDRDRPVWRWLLAGPPGSGTPIHQDPWGYSSWNASCVGVKRWVLFPPSVPHATLHPPRQDWLARATGAGQSRSP